MTYEAESLADLANMLSQLAIREAGAAQRANTQKARCYHRGTEFAYKDAVQILQNTRFINSGQSAAEREIFMHSLYTHEFVTINGDLFKNTFDLSKVLAIKGPGQRSIHFEVILANAKAPLELIYDPNGYEQLINAWHRWNEQQQRRI